MKKKLKKLSSLLLIAVMLVSLIPANVVRAAGEYWYITFSEDKDALKNPENNTSYESSEENFISNAYINPTSAIGKFAKKYEFDSIVPWASYNMSFDVSGELPVVEIIEDNMKYTALNFLGSNIDPKTVDEVHYVLSSVDLSDFFYDEDWDCVYAEENVYDEIVLAPNEMIDIRANMPDYNEKTDVFLVEVQTYFDGFWLSAATFGPFVFRSQLENHAGKLVPNITGEDSNEIYRVRNPKNNEHLLTSDPKEVVKLQLRG